MDGSQRRVLVGTAGALVAVAALIAVAARLGFGAGASSSAPAASPPAPVPSSLRALPRRTIDVGGKQMSVVVADTEPERQAGLQGVADLGPLDGMLFEFPGPTDTPFWMKDTLIPLDIAFFDGAGRLVSALTMPVCTADPCPTYAAAGRYVHALEAPAGRLRLLASDTRLTIEPVAS